MSVSDVITCWFRVQMSTFHGKPFVFSSFYMALRDLVRETNELLDAMNDFTAVEGEIGGDGVLLLET